MSGLISSPQKSPSQEDMAGQELEPRRKHLKTGALSWEDRRKGSRGHTAAVPPDDGNGLWND